jgi:hypothetical protein
MTEAEITAPSTGIGDRFTAIIAQNRALNEIHDAIKAQIDAMLNV